ncbi:MAG: hypothetical protein KME45_19560 [Stenomitos rutilans HA7619-LM2]|jgi:hypothetical protein|nr:hypothetical protein [Stenomitos rutilans HA7619-LM2]
MREFGLTLEQTRVLFSYQYHLVLAEIDSESKYEKKILKKQWLSKWKESTELFLKSQVTQEDALNSSSHLIIELSLLKSVMDAIKAEKANKLTFRIILLEIVFFIPYYQLGSPIDKKFQDLKIADKKKWVEKLKYFAFTLGIEQDCVDRYKSNYEKAISEISGKGANLLIGGLVGTLILVVVAAFATPLVAGLLAPILAPGLSGAAAISAVLAALGGGAIAVGGFGMAGGFAVIVGGGAILGAGAGAGIGALLAQSPDTALSQAAKLEVVMRELIFIQKDFRLVQDILKEQKNAIRSLEDERDKLLFDKEKNRKEIDNLAKSINFLKKALEINQNLLASDINNYIQSPVCSSCTHLSSNFESGRRRRCKAFEKIPDEIWKGQNDHRKLYPGDKGIIFKDSNDKANQDK